jgi:phosphoserine phosphatase
MNNAPDKHLAAFDIDNTLTNTFLVVPVMKSERDNGLLDSNSFDAAMDQLAAFRRNEIDYETAAHGLMTSHAQGLAGKSYNALKEHAHQFITSHPEFVRPFARQVMDVLRPTHELVAVTAEPEYMASAVIALLGMDRALTSRYAVASSIFTGEIDVSLAHRDEKRRILGSMRPDIAFGDSAGDIEMLAHAHNAYCISPDAALKEEAQKHDWRIFDGDHDTDRLVAAIRTQL